MRMILLALVALALSTSSGFAAQCRDHNGKFMKCPPAIHKPVHCRDHSGKFAKCGAPGAHPVD